MYAYSCPECFDTSVHLTINLLTYIMIFKLHYMPIHPLIRALP